MLDKLFWEVDYFPALVGSKGGIDHCDNASVLGLIVQFRQVLSIAREYATMRTLAVIFVLALIAIAGGIYSDAVVMSGRAPHADPDPASWAVAHAVKSRRESRP
jgi:hypothetical protein